MVCREGQHEGAVIGIFELPGTSAHSKAAGTAKGCTGSSSCRGAAESCITHSRETCLATVVTEVAAQLVIGLQATLVPHGLEDFLVELLVIHLQLLCRLSPEIDAKVIKTMLHVASCHLLLATCCLPVAVVLVVAFVVIIVGVVALASGRIGSRLRVVAAASSAVLLLRVITTTAATTRAGAIATAIATSMTPVTAAGQRRVMSLCHSIYASECMFVCARVCVLLWVPV